MTPPLPPSLLLVYILFFCAHPVGLRLIPSSLTPQWLLLLLLLQFSLG